MSTRSELMNPAILVRNLSKYYKLGVIGRQSVVDEVRYWWLKIRRSDPNVYFSKLGHTATEARKVMAEQEGHDRFWALKDVSFDVQPGEVVGIIGRNGAGKSTLLKILSRITEPSSGEAVLNGRVASLLEVGTGFHPELTGLENIYMNGTILGMKKREIDAKLDEIVAFSELDKFIETPVKRYSSGMYVRLAFAVAAHLDPEILLVDEILAVGDSMFQRKCLGKMGEVAKGGRTVLFVSHNIASVGSLCTKGIVLSNGEIDLLAINIEDAISRYVQQIEHITTIPLSQRQDRKGEGRIRVLEFNIENEQGCSISNAVVGKEINFRIIYQVRPSIRISNVIVAISLTAITGQFMTMLCNEISEGTFFEIIPEKGCFNCVIDRFPFPPGSYFLNITVRSNGVIEDWIQEAVILNVEAGDFFGTGRIPPSSHAGFFVNQRWSVQS